MWSRRRNLQMYWVASTIISSTHTPAWCHQEIHPQVSCFLSPSSALSLMSSCLSASSLLSSCPIVHSHRFLVFCEATNTSKWQMMGPKGQHNKTTGVIVALWTVMGYNSRYRIISVLSVQNTKLLIQSELSLTMIHRIYQIWHILQKFPKEKSNKFPH